jgi:hypothetical protein
MNVFPIPTPNPVRSSITIDQGVLGNPVSARTGVRSTVLNSSAAQSAVSDMQA